MRVFELHFNPKNKEDKIIDSFVYEPESIYEKRLGGLYMAGELNKALPQNNRFLKNLASLIKKEYYNAGLKKSCQAALQDALKKANDFFDAEVKKGNVSWLGNLNFGILSFGNFFLNFTKIGDLRVLLTRNGETSDISQNLESQEAEIYPLKVFGSIVSGKIVQDDKILVLNKEVFTALTQKGDFLKELGQASGEKDVKEILKKRKNIFTEFSGVCLLLLPGEGEAKETLSFQQTLPKFSFKKTFIKPLTSLPFYKLKPKIKKPSVKMPSVKMPSLKTPSLKLPQIKIPTIKIPKIKIARKNLILVIIFILVLAAIFFVFKDERERELNEARQKIDKAREKIILAESLLILDENEKAQTLFEEAWEIINPLTKIGMPLRNEAISIKKSLEKYLK